MRKSRIDEKAIGMFRDDLMSLEQIGRFFEVSRTAVKKFLNKYGVNTSKGQFFIICDNCGVKSFRPRCQIRGKIHKFCSDKCYYEFINNPEYLQNRHGQRIGRKRVEEKFGYIPEFVLHHKDGNDLNNELSNLVVFKNHSDHMKFHRFRLSLGLDCESGKWENIQKQA